MRRLLAVQNLSTYFTLMGKKIYGIRDISFDLYSGETLAIVGESGSGKSVLAKSLVGLNPKEISQIEQGEVLYEGVNLTKLPEHQLREYRGRDIGMVLQDAMASLNPTMKVGYQVLESYMLRHKEMDKQTAYKKVIELFTLSGISSPEDRFSLYPHELSGGQRQRIMIAMALALEPKILIADEPTTALDVTIQAQILELLRDLQKKMGMSIIFITHDLSLAFGFSSRILVMYGGSIVESAPTKELFQNPLHPYTKRLIESIPHLNLEKQKELIPIEGAPPSPVEHFSGCRFYPRCTMAKPMCQEVAPSLLTLLPERKTACWEASLLLPKKKEKLALYEESLS